jgi:predicted cation transporter
MPKMPAIHVEGSFLGGTPRKAWPFVVAIALGVLAWVLSPMMALLVLIGVTVLLPIERRARMSLVIIGCLSICLGAALAVGDLPFSQIAALKLQGSPCLETISGML